MARPLFGSDCARRDFGIFALVEEPAELITIQHFFPTLVGLPFVVAFPGKVGLVTESVSEEAEEFSPAGSGPGAR